MMKQLFGSEVDLKHNSPLNVEHDGKTGRPMEQLFGSEVPMSHTPVQLQEDQHNTGHMMQLFGSEVDLGMRPQKGWESKETPMSERARQASR